MDDPRKAAGDVAAATPPVRFSDPDDLPEPHMEPEPLHSADENLSAAEQPATGATSFVDVPGVGRVHVGVDTGQADGVKQRELPPVVAEFGDDTKLNRAGHHPAIGPCSCHCPYGSGEIKSQC